MAVPVRLIGGTLLRGVGLVLLCFVLGVATATAATVTSSLTQAAGTDGCFHSNISLTSPPGCAVALTADTNALQHTRSVVIHPNGLVAYAAAEESDSIMIFDRDPTTGALTARAGDQYASCWVELSGYGGGYGTNDCAQESRLNGVRDLAISPDGQNLYAVAAEANAIVAFAITDDGYLYALSSVSHTANACITSDAVFTAGYPCTPSNTTTLAGANSVLVSDDGNNVYVTGDGLTGGVSVFGREFDGSLSIPGGRNDCAVSGGSGAYCQDVHSISRAQDLVSDGEHIYVASQGGLNTITVFDRDSSTGYLTPHAGSDECVSQDSDGPIGISPADDSACESSSVGSIDEVSGLALTPDGSYLHAVSSGSDALSTFVVDNSGNLEQLPADAEACITSGSISDCDTATGGMSDPEKVAVSPDGYSLYVASSRSDAVAHFTLDQDTGIATQSAAPTGCAEDPAVSSGECDSARVLYYANNVTVSDDSNFVYVSAFGEGDLRAIAGQLTEGSVSIFSRAVSVSSEETLEADDEGDKPGTEEESESDPPVEASGTDTPTTNSVSSDATSTSAGESSSACISLVGSKRIKAITRWEYLARMALRIETKSGAFLRRDREKKGQFLLKQRGIEGGSRSVKRVEYYVDGAKAGTATRDPWKLLVDPATLSSGGHTIKAVVHSSETSKTVTLELPITVTDRACESARYSLATLSKQRRATTNLRFWWRSGDATLTDATAVLPRAITVNRAAFKRYGGRVFGGIQTIAQDGTRTYTKFKLPRRLDANGRAALVTTAAGVRVTFTAKTGGRVEVNGLSDGVNDVRVWLRGKTIKLFRNVNRCSKLNSKAELRNSVSSLTLTTNAALCTNRR